MRSGCGEHAARPDLIRTLVDRLLRGMCDFGKSSARRVSALAKRLEFTFRMWTMVSSDDLLRLMGTEGKDGLSDPDDAPEPSDAATTQPGDLGLLSDHRLLCGDSSKPEDLDPLLGGELVHLINTDPPYNVKVEPRSNNASRPVSVHSPLPNTKHPTSAILPS
jgi:hypothetical protein